MNFESLIFDIDGTLWDSRALVAEGYNIQLEREGLSHLFVTEEILRPLFGKVMTEIADAILAAVYHPQACCCEDYVLPENLKRFFEGKEGKGKKQLYVLTGFLGAGKTSLLLHLLDNLEGR